MIDQASDDGSISTLSLSLSLEKKSQIIQIRAYPSDARGPLTNQPDGPEWRAALRKYLSDVGCPREASGRGGEEGDRAKDGAAASWLLFHALSLSYSDERDNFTERAELSISQQIQRGIFALDEADAAAPAAGGGPPFVDLGSGAVRSACDELCLALGVAKDDGDGGNDDALSLARRLERAEEALTERYLPVASAFAEAQRASSTKTDAAAAADAAAPSSSSSTSAFSFAAALLDAQPLGFTTGDAFVDRGAKALRWLYVRDLALLQKDVDAAIVGVQNLTANPRTDAALGKVGR